MAEGILVERIELIMEKENVVVSEEGKRAIILTSEGDPLAFVGGQCYIWLKRSWSLCVILSGC